LRGRNLYPQDVEIVAEAAHPDLRAGGSAAFGVELDGEERLVIAMEVEARRSPDAAEVSEAVKLAVVDAMDAAIHEVLLLPAGTLPRTSSGKVRRSTTRASWLAGTLKDEEGE
jgi:acyl-CoA synthetase (AMP-forming)/AMP-acid ligase II